jgi:prephenate dehydrogenase
VREIPLIAATREEAPPEFERIGIVGLGLVGGSLALACRATWPKALVIGVDRNDVLEQAIVRHAIDVGADDLGMLAEADLVILAAPVRSNRDLLSRLDEHVRGSAIVTDVGGTKRAIVEAARDLPDRLVFVGGHPFAGAARSGIEFGAPELFKGRPWFLTPEASTPGSAVSRVTRFVEALGARPRLIDPAAHDEMLAMLSHVPQVVGSALMHVIGTSVGQEGLDLAGRGLRDTTRLASSPTDVWADVAATNADALGPALDAVIDVLSSLRADLSDGARLREVFDSAREWRQRLERGQH